ncbi:unnamed protein product [Timema podura]|uniref:Uncharacterized protein n=1 Tax=Timema podura TaxID=61482 RepID=A0ABN7NCS3_TIMPD|nr:unnamed protein product [Timema podura]
MAQEQVNKLSFHPYRQCGWWAHPPKMCGPCGTFRPCGTDPRDSYLDLPVLGSLARHETSALADYATEADSSSLLAESDEAGGGWGLGWDGMEVQITVFVCLALVAIALCAPQSPKDVTVLQYINDVRPDGYDLLFETSDGTLRQETGVLKNPGTG